MRRELAQAHKRLREIIKLANEALACNDGLFGRGGKPADFRHKRRMDKIEHRLDTRLSGFSEIVRMFSAQAFLHMPPSDREWTDDEIEQAGKTYYTAYLDNAETLDRTLRFRIDALFRDAGIVIAFPQRDVHLDTSQPLDIRIRRDRGDKSAG